VIQLVTKEATQGSGRAAEPLALRRIRLNFDGLLPHNAQPSSSQNKFFFSNDKYSTSSKTIHCAQSLLDCQLLIIQSKLFRLVNFHTLPTHNTTHNPTASPSKMWTNSTNRQYLLVKALFHAHKVSSLFIVS